MEFTVGLESPFSLEYTLESGQVFRWENRGEWWYGLLPEGVLRVRQEGDLLRCASESEAIDGAFVRHYFRLDADLDGIVSSIMKDERISRAVQTFYGLRLIRQRHWECLASFVLATNSNIPRIRGMIRAVCEKLGRAFESEGATYFAFPEPDVVADAPLSELAECGLGYRAPFLKHVAEAVSGGRVDFGEISLLDYEDARRTLVERLEGVKTLPGVGPKVADCVLLYSFEKDEAFPIDVWIAREIIESYPGLLDTRMKAKLGRPGKARIGAGDYASISAKVRSYFGIHAGYAQQYLYMLARAKSR